MFKCQTCKEKDRHIDFIEKQNKDLYDRLMAFNKEAFAHYKAESRTTEALYPFGMDKNGEMFSYNSQKLNKIQEDVSRAMCEDMVTVEDKYAN